jgi:hypothetical protein
MGPLAKVGHAKDLKSEKFLTPPLHLSPKLDFDFARLFPTKSHAKKTGSNPFDASNITEWPLLTKKRTLTGRLLSQSHAQPRGAFRPSSHLMRIKVSTERREEAGDEFGRLSP